MEPAPQPLVVVDSLSPLRRFLDRAKLPPDVLALQAEEEPPAEAGQQNDKGRLDGEAGVLLVNDGQPAVRLVDATRLAAMYGMTGANVDNISQAPASPPTAAASSSSPSPQPSLSLSRSSSPLPLIAGLFSPSSGHNGGGGGRRRRHGAGIGRTTADVFIPVPTADPCGLARRAVAAGATLEAMGATGGAAAERQQHVMVRPPGGALVLVLTAPAAAPAEEEGGEGGRGSKASRPKSTTKAPPPTGAADADDEDGQGQGEEEAGEQEVGLEAGEAGIGTYFPTLRIEHKCCRNPGEVYANTPRPIPVETDAFAGHALLLIRDDSRSPPEPRHHYYMFEGKQRRFNIQVQGKLKRPVDNLYFGGEVTSKMELGLLAKGFARTILGFIRALQPGMHHSFGDDHNVVLAHICAPLFQAAETFVLTPPGGVPPPLGENFPMTDQDKLRRAGKLPAPRLEVGATLSFSFHSMFIDFQSWRLVNFPLIRSLDLHLMWAKSALRFVVYEPRDAEHRQASNNYLYVLQLQHSSNLTGGRTAAEEEADEADKRSSAEAAAAAAAAAATTIVARPLLRGTSLEAEAEAEAAEDEGGLVGAPGTDDEEEEEMEVEMGEEESMGEGRPSTPPSGAEGGGGGGDDAAATAAAATVVEDYFPASPSKKGRLRSLSGSASWFPPPPPAAAFADSKGPHPQPRPRRRRRRFLPPLPRLRPEEKSFALSPPSAADAAGEEEEEDDEEGGQQGPPGAAPASGSDALARLLLEPSGGGGGDDDPLDLVPAWLEAAAVADGGGGGGGAVAAVAAAVVPDAVLRRRRAGRGAAYRLWFAVCLGGRLCRLRGRKAILGALRPVVVVAAAEEPSSASAGVTTSNPRFSDREQQRRQLCALVAAARAQARAGDARALAALVTLLGEPSPTDRAFLAGELLRPSPSPPPPAVGGGGGGAAAASPARGSVDGTSSREGRSPSPVSSPPPSPLAAAKGAATGLIARTLSASALHYLLKPSATAPPRPAVLLTGPVARCLGDRHWAEERLVLTPVALSFYPPHAVAAPIPGSSGNGDPLAASLSFSSSSAPAPPPYPPRLTVAIQDILSATVCLTPEDGPPFPGGDYAFFEVQTLGRVHTCMARTAEAAAAWAGALEGAVAAASKRGSAGGEGEETEAAGAFMSGYAVSASATLLGAAGGTGTVAESFVAAPSHWALGDRVVLTARRPVLGRAARANIRAQDPCAVVSRLLQFGFTLDASSGAEEIAIFLDGAAALKHLDPVRLLEAGEAGDEAEVERRKKAFFLNLYTTGILLARLILGPPPANAALKWCGYYTSAAVEALGDLFSLAEIEHNVLRSPSPRPRGALLRFLLPNTRYPRALTPRRPDLRLNFALNCGSLSCPAAVPVYDPDTLEAQLNLVTRFVLDGSVRVEEGARVVVLPKVCQWYARDLGGQLFPLLLQCLSPPKAAALRRMLAAGAAGGGKVGMGEEALGGGVVAIKYAPFSFETRPLRRLDEEEEAMLMQM